MVSLFSYIIYTCSLPLYFVKRRLNIVGLFSLHILMFVVWNMLIRSVVKSVVGDVSVL